MADIAGIDANRTRSLVVVDASDPTGRETVNLVANTTDHRLWVDSGFTSVGTGDPIDPSTDGILIFGSDGSNYQPVSVDSSGVINVNISDIGTGATEATLSALNGKFNTLGQKLMGGSVPVTIASDQTPIEIIEEKSTSATVSTVSASAVVVTLLTASSRLGATVYNNSSSNMYLKFGTGASTTDFSVILNEDAYMEVPYPYYQGIITAIWDSAVGDCKVTSFS